MNQRGRKSAASSLIPNIGYEPPRLMAPVGLTAKERALFCRIIDGSDPKHFRQNEVELLVSYVQAVLLVRDLGRKRKIVEWERAVRIQLALAMRLRLAPSTRLDPKTVNRFQVSDYPPPWDDPKSDDDAPEVVQ
jgi:hypothetical protein